MINDETLIVIETLKRVIQSNGMSIFSQPERAKALLADCYDKLSEENKRLLDFMIEKVFYIIVDELEQRGYIFGATPPKFARVHDITPEEAEISESWVRGAFGSVAYDTSQVPKSPEEAFSWYYKRAIMGIAEAQADLGICYLEGKGVKRSYETAVEWFRKSAEQDYKIGQHYLAHCLYNGLGIKEDKITAAILWEKSAMHGYAPAQYCIGMQYLNGTVIDKDLQKSFRFITLSACQNNADAQYTLAYMYDNGLGVKKDPRNAVNWYIKAATNGAVLAQAVLGKKYASGEDVEADNKKALEWYRKAAGQGDYDSLIEFHVISETEEESSGTPYILSGMPTKTSNYVIIDTRTNMPVEESTYSVEINIENIRGIKREALKSDPRKVERLCKKYGIRYIPKI